MSKSDRSKPPQRWDDIARFALSFSGYQHAGSIAECAERASRVSRDYLLEGAASLERLDTDELRLALFFEQRRTRHFGIPPDPLGWSYVTALVGILCHRLGVDEVWDAIDSVEPTGPTGSSDKAS